MKRVTALVLTGFGINCEEEMAAAYRLAGAQADIAHLNDLIAGKGSIHNYDVINFPGGFSFGDDIASGKVLANKIKYKKLNTGSTLLEEIVKYLDDGRLVVGICNGFQVLVRLGLLPNISGRCVQEASLIHNDTGHFINNWCTLKNNSSNSLFLNGLAEFDVPIRHGEGKLVFINDEIRQAVIDLRLNVLSYINNPNGSELDCAGLTDPRGRVLGMMPHPEAFLSAYNHPDWNRRRLAGITNENGAGLLIFKNIVEYITNKLQGEPQ